GLLVGGQGELGGLVGEGPDLLGVGLVVGVDGDGQLARLGPAGGRDHPQVGAALVDDPGPVGADAGPADALVLVVGHLHRLGTLRRLAGGGDRRHSQADEVGRRAVDLADVIEGPAVGAPHGRGVLAVEVGQAAVVGAVGVAQPDVVVGRAAVALAIPQAGAA